MTTEIDEIMALYEQPEVAVAAVTVQVIGELNRMLLEGWAHDQKSIAMVVGTVAWLTSVLDGKAANPAHIGEGFVNACTALDQSMLDEIDRCQHYLTETLKAKAEAESKALLNELYASWYLRLRDARSGSLVVIDQSKGAHIEVQAEDLDAEMEELDQPTAAIPSPELENKTPEDPLFDSFDDDVLF